MDKTEIIPCPQSELLSVGENPVSGSLLLPPSSFLAYHLNCRPVVWQLAHWAIVLVSHALSISPWPWLRLLFVHFLPQPASLFQQHKQKNGTLNLNRTASGRVELQSVLSRRFPPPWHTLVEVENNWIKETAPSLRNTSDFDRTAKAMRLELTPTHKWLKI